MYYKLGRAGRALDRFGVIEFATTIAPGVRDVLLTGKVYEAVQRNSRNKGATRYDAVVLDAPPTGRIAQFLNVNNELAGLAKVGPIKSQADTVMTLFRSPRTAVHLVTVLEEMPVQETDRRHRRAARGASSPSAASWSTWCGPGTCAATDLAAARTGQLDPAGIAADLGGSRCRGRRPGWSRACSAEARDHAERRALEDAQRELVDGLGRPDLRAPAAGRRRRPRRPLRARGPR